MNLDQGIPYKGIHTCKFFMFFPQSSVYYMHQYDIKFKIFFRKLKNVQRVACNQYGKLFFSMDREAEDEL